MVDTAHGNLDAWRPRTRLVRGGLNRSQHMETAEAMYMTSGYVYGSAEEADAKSAGCTSCHTQTDRHTMCDSIMSRQRVGESVGCSKHGILDSCTGQMSTQ